MIFLTSYFLNNNYLLNSLFKGYFYWFGVTNFSAYIAEYLLEKMKRTQIYLASPWGFCAGVKRAIEIVEKSINKFGSPVYVRHEQHNKQVVEELKEKGAIFVDELSDVNTLADQ